MSLPAQDIVERVRFHGRYASENQDECTARKNAEREEAAAAISRLTADNEALTKHVAFLCDALGKERKSVWRDAKLSASTEEAVEAVLEWSADSARADALAQEVERLRLPEGTPMLVVGTEIIISFASVDDAHRAFDALEYAMSREPAALGDRP